MAEGSEIVSTDEPAEPEQAVALLLPAVAIHVEGAEAMAAIILSSTVMLKYTAVNDIYAWVLDKLNNFLKIESDTKENQNEEKDLRTEVIDIDNKPADRFGLKSERILSDAASTFFSFVTDVDNLIHETKYTNTYEEKIKKLLKEQKIKYEKATDVKKKDMKIYYPCSSVGNVASKALYGTGTNFGEGKNLQEATDYVKEYWTPTNTKGLDIITVSAEAAQALAVSVSTKIGKGGYSFTCRDNEVRHNKEGDLMHCHPGMKNPNPSGDPEIVQAYNDKYCPHLLYVIAWN
jgi:hypothetical protein